MIKIQIKVTKLKNNDTYVFASREFLFGEPQVARMSDIMKYFKFFRTATIATIIMAFIKT